MVVDMGSISAANLWGFKNATTGSEARPYISNILSEINNGGGNSSGFLLDGKSYTVDTLMSPKQVLEAMSENKLNVETIKSNWYTIFVNGTEMVDLSETNQNKAISSGGYYARLSVINEILRIIIEGRRFDTQP